jgi:hypothetical protein
MNVRVIAAGVFLLITIFLFIILARRGSFFLRHSMQFRLTAGYILLLLVSPFLLQILPLDNLHDMKMKAVSEKEMVHHEDLLQQATQGRPEQAEGAFVLKRWEFPFSGNLLNVELSENDLVIVERKESADGRIEAVNYATKTVVELIDFSEMMMPYRLTLGGNVLKVMAPQPLKIEMWAFSKEFAVRQILGESGASESDADSVPGSGNNSSSSAVIPGQVALNESASGAFPGTLLLYLRIPADVEIQSKNSITFVE